MQPTATSGVLIAAAPALAPEKKSVADPQLLQLVILPEMKP